MADADAVSDAGLPVHLTPGVGAPEPPAPAPPASAPATGEMTLVDHLTELRNRIIKIAIAVAVASTIGFYFSDQIVSLLKAPIPDNKPLYFTGLGDAFVIKLKISVVVGIILAMPVVLYQGWAFIAPGLTADERKMVRPWIPLALLFFAMGTLIAYVILPFAAGFLLGFSTPDLQPLITAEAYFGFVTTLFLAFGLVLEFPIILYGLSRVGIVTSALLTKYRRMSILGIAIFAAAVTPGTDLVSPAILGITMYVLFEGTIFFIRRSGK
jgi:sec-independent protein translocase protein TatC